MNATELFRAGKLQAAIDEQLQEVKSNPGDQNRRLFLFELLALAGDLDRAERQIGAVEYGDPPIDAAVVAYKQFLKAERQRRALFAEGREPKFLVPPPEHVRHRLAAVQHLREGREAEASAALDAAAAATPAVAGTLNDKPFQSLRDGDDLFGGVLEVVAKDQYFWVPFEEIASVTIAAPKAPRDVLAVPATLEAHSGDAGDVLLPGLYPGTHAHDDDALRLGRAADWRELAGGALLGVGGRVLQADGDAVSLVAVRTLTLRPPAAS